VAPLTIALMMLFLYSQKKILSRTVFWALFWLAGAIKFMSLPLLVPFFYLKNLSFKKEIMVLILGFLLIWGLPLAIFRSSLSVSFVFHAKRPFKYASLPAYLVETVDRFTHTETRVNQPPDFQLEGPISEKVTQVFGLLFLLSIVLVIFYALKKILTEQIDPFVFATKITLIFFLTIFLTGKIFSQPFHIWYLPLITIFPFSKVRQQLIFMLLALWLLIVDTTPWIRINENAIFWAPLTWKFVTYFFRFLPMFILLILSFKLPNKIELHNRR